MTVKEYTADQVIEDLGAIDDDVRRPLDAWLAQGMGVAIYRNVALDSADLGNYKFASFGTPDAIFEGDPPEQLPDTDTEINWRYRLAGTFRGDKLPEFVAREWATPAEVLNLFVKNTNIDDVPSRETWPNGRLRSYSMTVDGVRMGISAHVLTARGSTATCWLRAAVNAKGMVDRLGEFEWSTLVRGTSSSATVTGLGPAHVAIYNSTLDKEGA